MHLHVLELLIIKKTAAKVNWDITKGACVNFFSCHLRQILKWSSRKLQYVLLSSPRGHYWRSLFLKIDWLKHMFAIDVFAVFGLKWNFMTSAVWSNMQEGSLLLFISPSNCGESVLFSLGYGGWGSSKPWERSRFYLLSPTTKIHDFQPI